jgi:hypothetical protein
MARIERLREALTGEVDQSYMNLRAEAGWRIVAVEWEREIPGEESDTPGRVEPIPFGLRIASDCRHLEEDPVEMQVLYRLMQMIVQDISISRMAEDLNDHGFHTRAGEEWTAVRVFNIFPRLVDMAPRIIGTDEWAANRRRLAGTTWNS